MTLNIPHRPKSRVIRNERQSREAAESMLRDIAFVLKMTERVRNEIEPAKKTASVEA